MRLSKLEPTAGIEVVRDGEFRSLGLLSGTHPETLACLYDSLRVGDWQTNNSLSCIITTRDLAASVPNHIALALSDAPRKAFVDAQRLLGSNTELYGDDFASVISPEACIHPGAQVAERNVRIEAGCIVEPGAIVLGRVTLERGCTLRAGAVVGAEGFHPVPYGDGIVNMPHFGSVVIGERADVGANSVVCRSVFSSPTEIGVESVLGPLVYIAHGVRIGERCRIAASARICGSTVIGNRVFIGPNAVISNLIAVGDGARVSIGSVVVRDVPAGQTVTGNFAIEHRQFLDTWKRQLR